MASSGGLGPLSTCTSERRDGAGGGLVTVSSAPCATVAQKLRSDPVHWASMNSQRSQIVDLTDPGLMPDGWQTLAKPPLAAPEDTVIYELHMRDFSMNDATVPEEHRGKYLAFTDVQSLSLIHI